ncbi:uncharacterized protein JCM6883_004867 [Sporobolomyces salmoneus]|uniref:uncharacterized protein n=1 Tax=Sporobolomyces salmoneus TaxID=183962 RepID=UPI0031747588
MTRILAVSLLLTSALSAAQASLLFPRQESTSTSLDQVYQSLETFATEVTSKIAGGQCTESDSCGGWLQSALDCVGDGSANEEALAKCACQEGFLNSFGSCVTCVGTDSANQAGSALTQACSTGSSSSAAPSESASQSDSSSNGSVSATSSGSSPSSSASTTGSATPSSASAQPTAADAGSGVGKLALNKWNVVGSVVGAGLIAGLYA